MCVASKVENMFIVYADRNQADMIIVVVMLMGLGSLFAQRGSVHITA